MRIPFQQKIHSNSQEPLIAHRCFLSPSVSLKWHSCLAIFGSYQSNRLNPHRPRQKGRKAWQSPSAKNHPWSTSLNETTWSTLLSASLIRLFATTMNPSIQICSSTMARNACANHGRCLRTLTSLHLSQKSWNVYPTWTSNRCIKVQVLATTVRSHQPCLPYSCCNISLYYLFDLSLLSFVRISPVIPLLLHLLHHHHPCIYSIQSINPHLHSFVDLHNSLMHIQYALKRFIRFLFTCIPV